jgi:hypothetical protein
VSEESEESERSQSRNAYLLTGICLAENDPDVLLHTNKKASAYAKAFCGPVGLEWRRDGRHPDIRLLRIVGTRAGLHSKLVI